MVMMRAPGLGRHAAPYDDGPGCRRAGRRLKKFYGSGGGAKMALPHSRDGGYKP
jgi:hypothetical protein